MSGAGNGLKLQPLPVPHPALSITLQPAGRPDQPLVRVSQMVWASQITDPNPAFGHSHCPQRPNQSSVLSKAVSPAIFTVVLRKTGCFCMSQYIFSLCIA